MGQLISLGFDRDEREFFARTLEQCGGPAQVTDALAVFVGFTDAGDMVKRCYGIADQVRREGHIDGTDLERGQLACEILFSSDIYGSDPDWVATTGPENLASLRNLVIGILNTIGGQGITALRDQIASHPYTRPLEILGISVIKQTFQQLRLC